MISNVRTRAGVRAMLVASLAVATALAAAWCPPASAQERREAIPALNSDHQSHLVIPRGGPYPLKRRVTIGAGKSMLLEVPTDLTNVLVSNPEVVDAVVQTSRQVYLLAKDTGEANAFFIGPNGQKVLFLEIVVERDLTVFSESLRRLLPGSRIHAEMIGGNLIMSGSVVDAQDANRAGDLAQRFMKKKEAVVNLITTTAKEQVLLRVKVAEMQRDALRRFGIDMPGAFLQTGKLTITEAIKNAFPITSSIVPAANAVQIGELPVVSAGKAVQATWESGNQSVTAFIQMLERTGLIRTLAEPNLTAMSGESAKFHAGGEFPVPISTQLGQFTIEWKEFGVKLSFKPVVLTEGRISLFISAEVSEISPEGSVTLNSISIPGVKKRTAETTLEIPSGGTLAMAGLLSDDTRESVEGVPGLKNLPVLGALFRSNDYRRRETELVILVTPYIATHAPTREFARPDEGFMPQNELKELFFGHINRVYGRPGSSPGRFHGDYGFIVEYPDPGVKG